MHRLNRKRAIANFASFLGSKGLALLLFFVGVRAFVLDAGTVEYGAINLVLVLYTYLWIADMGIGYAVNLHIGRLIAKAATTELPELHQRVRLSLSAAMPFYIGIGATLALLALVGRDALSEALFATQEYATLVAWTGLAAIPVMLSALASAILRAFDRVYLVNATQLMLDAWRASALILLATDSTPAISAGMAFFIGAMARAAADLSLVCRLLGWRWLRPRWSWEDIKRYLLEGAPTMGSLVLFAVFFSIDRIYASHAFSLSGVASYSLAADLHTKAYFLIWALNSALYQPLLARHSLGLPSRALVRLNVAGALSISVLYYLPLALFSAPILTLWINAQAASEAGPVVWAMLPGSVAYLFASSLENATLRTRGLVTGSMIVHSAMLGVMLLALAWLPRRYGLSGIGWSYSLAQATYLVGVMFASHGRRGSP